MNEVSAELLEIRRKNNERQIKSREKRRLQALADFERDYQQSIEDAPLHVRETNLINLQDNHPVEYSQVQAIKSEFERIKTEMRGFIDAANLAEEQSHQLLVRKPVIVPDATLIYTDMKSFESQKWQAHLYVSFKDVTQAPGWEFCYLPEGFQRGLWGCYGIYILFSEMFKREFLTASLFHLLSNGTPSTPHGDVVRMMCEELRDDVTRNFPDRNKAEMLKYYPNNERRFKGTGKLVHSFLTGEPISVSAEPKPKPVIVELPPGIGVRFSVGAQAFQRNQQIQ